MLAGAAHAATADPADRQAHHPAAARPQHEHRQPADEHGRHARRQVRHHQRHGLPRETVRPPHDRRLARLLDHPGRPDASTPNPDGLYYGLAVQPAPNPDGSYTVYAARGAAVNLTNAVQPGIGIYNVSAGGVLTHTGDITVKHGDFPAGLALSPDGKYLFAADNQFYALKATSTTDLITNLSAPGSLIAYSTATGAEVTRLPFGTEFSSFPLAVAVAGNQVYVTSQRDSAVYVVNAANLASAGTLSLTTTIPTGAHPSGLTVNRAGTRVYVANAHSDTVSVINTGTNAVTNTILLRPTSTPDLPGASPVGVTLSPDENTLYAPLGDMNAIAVVSLIGANGPQLQGYIPVGWYPTAVVNAPYKRLIVANAKGVQTQYPNPGYQQFQFNSDPQYDLNLIEGTAELLAVPNPVALRSDTLAVLNNNRLAADSNNPNNPLAGIGLSAGKIKHVIYIIKENRTYDQVLGDLPQGNGDPAITLFGANVTPNLHALASRFVLLDNFYDCAEASGDGWPWSTQSIATEYVIKNLPYNYSSRGRNYDFEGTVNNYPVSGIPNPAVGPHGNPLVKAGTPFASGGPAIPDVSEAPGRTGASGGHIWDNVRDAGLTSRDYGFFLSGGDGAYHYGTGNGSNTPAVDASGNPVFTDTYTPANIPDNFPASPGLFPAGSLDAANGVSTVAQSGAAQSNVPLTAPAQLTGSDVDFRKYDNAYPDSDAPINYYHQLGTANFLYPKTVFGFYNEPSRFSEWNRELQIMLAKGHAEGQDNKYVPNFMMVRFHHDHTQGLSAGVHTPRAEVADNDYSVGQLVQAVSADPALWNSTAIFVLQDDSQDGPDHVDCHRSTAYVISPFIKQGSVDHTFYNTDSILKTMEELLGLKPMSQYDAVATPILDWDTAPNNGAAYTATMPAASIIGEVAPAMAQLSPKDPRRHLELLSAKMDFVDPDSAPADLLNQIIWKSVKGAGSKMPAIRRTLTPSQLTGVHAAQGKAGAKAAAKTVARDGDDD